MAEDALYEGDRFMKNLVLKAVATVAVCMVAAPAFATTYECKLKMSKSGGNWMGPVIRVEYDEKNGNATVIDGVINHYFGQPLKVSKVVDNNKRMTFSYNTNKFEGTSTARAGKTFANRVYRLTILKPSLKASVHMKPVGYRNTWRDSGTCVRK
ncbi:hypothetical protein [Aliiroseovarius sp. F20344]|uniref:hypothetical protein n=1 Tax=Aliiroseovarius sp. F20344 TaxID=2926414 RepID=UPI001FF15A50|nr:hypothetical protein [Aliiroseovarius sp. F20344]MCK0143351.1 hypothetical protein [Aliiroseovarius sp. F20344]